MNNEDFCPIEDTLNYFNRKWVFCILMDMFRGKSHFNEFKEANPTLSSYVLSQTLKFMEKSLLIEKISCESKTEYVLTEKGLETNKILYEMILFSLNELEGSKLPEKIKKQVFEKYQNALNIDGKNEI